jgi:tryptophan-rich sensory protein
MSGATEPTSSKRFDVGLVVVSAACIVAWFLGGALTRPNLEWYDALVKPSFVPSNGFFPIVWTALYVMMAVSAWLVVRSTGEMQDKKLALIWFAIQLVIGVLWSVVFFAMHSPDYAFGVIMALIVAIVITIVLFDRLSRPASLLLLPYVLWVCFSAGINFTIWVLNSGYDFSQAQ